LCLTLSVAAYAQPSIAGQTTQAQSLLEEMRQMRQLIERQDARSRRLEAEKSESAARQASATSEAAASANKDTSPAAPNSSQAPTASSKAAGPATENATTGEMKKHGTDRAEDIYNAGKSEKTGQSDKTNKGTAPASASQQPPRRANPAPLDGVFPSSEYIGPSPLIGAPDTDPVYSLTEALWGLS